MERKVILTEFILFVLYQSKKADVLSFIKGNYVSKNPPLDFSFSRRDAYLRHADSRKPCDLPQQMARCQKASHYPPIKPCVS
jgi:hypothetical protein